ncbi:MAG: mechanosensitive ion channel domain-containing protein [Pseudomonadota bacterium]
MLSSLLEIVASTLRQPVFLALLQEDTGGSGAPVDVTNVDWWTSQLEALRPMGVEIGINLITAIVIFIVGRTIARMLSGAARKVMQRQEVDKILESFVSSLLYWALMTIVIIAAIDRLGVQTTSLIAVMGAAGLAVGLALQGSLSNFAAGVLIVLFRPYRVGDFIEAAGVAGVVLHVQILTTVLKTGDNKQIIIPNSEVMSSIITNYSANDTRRVDLTIGVSYDDNLDRVRTTLLEIVKADQRVLTDPECVIAVSELADSSVNFVVRPWVRTEDYWAVYFGLTETIKKRFDAEGISFPYPQQDVHIHQAASG